MHQLVTWISGNVEGIVGAAVFSLFTTLLKRRLLFWWRDVRMWVKSLREPAAQVDDTAISRAALFWHDAGKYLHRFQQRQVSTTFSRRRVLNEVSVYCDVAGYIGPVKDLANCVQAAGRVPRSTRQSSTRR